MKYFTVPNDLKNPPHYRGVLQINDFDIVESCIHTKIMRGSMFLKDHLLLFVLKGSNTLTINGEEYRINKNEMILVHKATKFDFVKRWDETNQEYYDGLMFFIKDDFLLDFMKMKNIKKPKSIIKARIGVKPLSHRLATFVQSIKNYFDAPEAIDEHLIKIKMLELLYDIAETDNNLLLQLLQLKKQAPSDISNIIEKNYMSPVSLDELAYLCGRSLSSFKRDFKAIYNESPASYIREKRLVKAQQLLRVSDMPIQDICYATGFETVSHFSRLYKSRFGYTPSEESKQIN